MSIGTGIAVAAAILGPCGLIAYLSSLVARMTRPK